MASYLKIGNLGCNFVKNLKWGATQTGRRYGRNAQKMISNNIFDDIFKKNTDNFKVFVKSSSKNTHNFISRPNISKLAYDIPQHHELNAHNISIRSFFENPNSRMFRNLETKKFYEEYIDEVDKSFKKLPMLDREYVFYRGISGEETLAKQKAIEYLENSKVGDLIVPDKAYAYTAYNKAGAIGYAGKFNNSTAKKVLLEIHTPRGARISCNSEHGGEGVFPRAAEYKVISKKYTGDGILEIVLNYILPKK